MESCCHGVSPLSIPIWIGTIPIRDDFNAPAINPGMVVLSQTDGIPVQLPTQTPAPMQMPITMPPLPNQNGALPYPSVPSPSFPSMPSAQNGAGMPGAPPNAYAPSAPSAPDFSQSKFGIFHSFPPFQSKEIIIQLSFHFHFRSTNIRRGGNNG